tara:strand:+ start:24289 stop:24654 length:366 start_codon:yes stop_codon:yes gene_type:complete
MEVNTHGIEEEENEHAIERRVYMDITPRPKQSEIVTSLKNQAGKEWQSRCTEHFAWKAADHIIELENNAILENEIQIIMWKSLERVKIQQNELEEENKFLKGLINKYHLEHDAFTGKGNIT